jgi:hypothetical protein
MRPASISIPQCSSLSTADRNARLPTTSTTRQARLDQGSRPDAAVTRKGALSSWKEIAHLTYHWATLLPEAKVWLLFKMLPDLA